MPYARADGVELFYDDAGDPHGRPLVLVAGTGAQLIAWHDDLVGMLAAAGFRVLRIDNRDVGLSQKFGGPRDVDGGYGLEDLADDVVRVLDAAGLARATIVGESMGGMIAQLVAIRHPSRVAALGLLSTIPGRSPRWVLHGDIPALQRPQPRFPRWLAVGATRFLGPGGTYPRDRAWERWAAGAAYDRCYAPDGVARQWAACLRAPERLELLRDVPVPTLVVHGRADPRLGWHAAVDTAAAMPDAELRVHPGMGHGLPRALWADTVAALVRTVDRADVTAPYPPATTLGSPPLGSTPADS